MKLTCFAMSQTPQPVQSISLLEFELMINTVNLLWGVIVSLAAYLEQHGARCRLTLEAVVRQTHSHCTGWRRKTNSDEFWCLLLCLRVITFIKDDVKEANKHISEDYVHIIYWWVMHVKQTVVWQGAQGIIMYDLFLFHCEELWSRRCVSP